MKILVVGSGGREHALAWRLSKSPGTELYAVPGNPGLARLAHCIPATQLTPQSILALAQNLGVNLTVIGPEAPLIAGVTDLFRTVKLPLIGCTAEAARLEGSKVYAKRFFDEHRIPTARFEAITTNTEAMDALSRFTFPMVIKADGLAAGKGVVIAQDRAQAEHAIAQLGPTLVIEEFLQGHEVSFIVLSDGETVVPLLPSRDHKRALDGNQGPNTGGMGAYCSKSLLSETETGEILDRIILPTVRATGFTGFLYAGLMMTAEGPRLLEYNVRLGDPEAQALMYQLDDDLPEILLATAQGRLDKNPLRWASGVGHCVVLAAEGYPGPYRSSDPIVGIADAENCGAAVFHAGTRVSWSGYATAGGRVLGVTTTGPTLAEAARKSYTAVSRIHFEGMHFRRDIGLEPERLS